MEKFDIIVVGLGCGAAICERASRLGYSVLGLGGGNNNISCASNQRWKHSGALFLEQQLALELWNSFSTPNKLEIPYSKTVGALFASNNELINDKYASVWESVGIPFRFVNAQRNISVARTGHPQPKEVAMLPDATIDFPLVIRDTLHASKEAGATILSECKVTNIDVGNDFTVVSFCNNRSIESVRCRHLVVASGAWSEQIANMIGVRLPLANHKSHLLEYDVQISDNIVVFLDEPQFTLVPFNGRTLVGNAHRQIISNPADRSVDVATASEMDSAFRSTFERQLSSLKSVEMRPRACIKTELFKDGESSSLATVFDQHFHGLAHVTFVVPGKASLMFSLAKKVITTLDAILR
jgi:hypothetical protein